MNAKTPIFTIVVVLVMHTVTLAQAINQGASPSQPDIVVNFDVDNPNVTIYAVMPGDGGQNSTDAYAEFTLNGTGGAGGSFIAYSNGGTGWAGVSGEYIAWSGDFSSTFKAEGVRTNSTDLNSTFTVKQGLDATGVGGLSFSPTTGNLTGGFYVIGETGACAIGDTWALGMTESFVGSAESLTVTLGREFEQRSNDGTIAGSPR